MLPIRRISVQVFCLAILWMAGCEVEPAGQVGGGGGHGFDTAAGFEVDRVHIVGLTRMVTRTEGSVGKTITAFVDVLDVFDSRIKAPCRFRFELYEFLPRSGQNLGARVAIWEEFDLSGAAANNAAWKDHLRAYQFELNLEKPVASDKAYMLQVTCMTAGGKRLTDTYKIG